MGLLLFLLLLGSYFFFIRRDNDRKYKGVVLAFALFACFSYPGENIALLFGLAACMGAARGGELFHVPLSPSRKCIISIVLAGCIYANVRIVKEYRWLTLVAGQPLESARIPRYKNEPEALRYFLCIKESLNLSDQLKMQEWISKKLPSPETYCELGCLYEQMKEYDKAEKCYQMAADMVPNQIRANYFLFKLYETTGRTPEAHKMATFISRQNIKIENTFTLSVQGEVARFLKKVR